MLNSNPSPSVLTAANYERGMLVDDEWMAGISKESEGFMAFVVNHFDGSLVARQIFPDVTEALAAVNRIPRSWRFEATGGCSGERCGQGKCKGGGCKIYVGPKQSDGPSCGGE